MSSFNPKTAPTTALFSRLRRSFSPSRWLRHSEGLTQLTEGGGRPEWLLARGMCAYVTFNGSDIPERKRKRFIETAIARWSPFADPRAHVEWVRDLAMVWAWPTERVLLDAEGVRLPPPQRIVPESLFRGQPLAAGEQLVAMHEGVEGRVWRDGHLEAARWWPKLPGQEDWNEFRRGAGLAPASVLPDVLEYPIAAIAWGAPGGGGLSELVTRQRTLLAALAVALAMLGVVAPLVGAIALKVSIWQVKGDIETRERAIAPIIAAREAAQADAEAIDSILRMRPPAGQTELMAGLIKLIPGQWQLIRWEMPDADHVELGMKMRGADPRRIVEAWEKSGQFSEVTAEIVRQPDELLIKARILPKKAVP